MKPDDIEEWAWKNACQCVPDNSTGAGAGVDWALRVNVAKSLMAEREACIQVVKDHPHFEVLSDDESAKHGVMARQTGRQDIIDAIRSRP